MIKQLNPCLPVYVLGRGYGECIAWIDYSQEHHLIWVVVLDGDGSVWQVPNPDIRFAKNYTIGRDLYDRDGNNPDIGDTNE